MNNTKTLKLKGNCSKEVLQKIIVTPTGRPDRFAIHLYLYIRTQIQSRNSDVLKISYKDLMKANYCFSQASMRSKLSRLQQLSLIEKSLSTEVLPSGRTIYNILNISLVEVAQ